MNQTVAMETIHWRGERDGVAVVIDQTLLPDRCEEIELTTPEQMVHAIQRLAVRGAPAIGVAGAYGVCLATRNLTSEATINRALEAAYPLLRHARPTAVNLSHMIRRMEQAHRRNRELPPQALRDRLLEEARAIHQEDRDLCSRIAAAGAPLIKEGAKILTHCNAGALATAGEGTALAPLYLAHRQGRRFQVFAGETRPLLQGARLTAWELGRAGIAVTLICDNAAAHFFAREKFDLVITGADRIARNGDTANKIGTYSLAELAHAHGVPFYVAAPSTTFDLALESGEGIPIEERAPEEIWRIIGKDPIPAGVTLRNPAFDVTPARLIAGWITDRGILSPPFDELTQ